MYCPRQAWWPPQPQQSPPTGLLAPSATTVASVRPAGPVSHNSAYVRPVGPVSHNSPLRQAWYPRLTKRVAPSGEKNIAHFRHKG
ncbi:hypothetical protein PoB_006280500 [Plakobranchus ocellatus]|uniref:Uncharacterized protein n=1 Tax=Plakobranchus ocellatus TaxID=259542 RepID=A0AAV4CWS0_9GAST|nr:hypothetical protein PoB_006280500 [Plakobranchus ocellatus]